MFTLGTIIVSDDIPSFNDTPSQNPNCDEDRCHGRVWIYHSTVDKIEQWGTISKYLSNNYAETIICRQLGYKESHDLMNYKLPSLDDSAIIWMTNSKLLCEYAPESLGSYKNNILQCEHIVCTEPEQDGCGNHSTDLAVNCSEY